ncbi:MAG: hypothetical protein C6I00_00315 [Nitratiruptor sp.]|nr:hypothetical protein [Nitratiruptor sp.]NPA83688.1 DUF190 domain-containing protein [Campylobacterota bacterium]
MKRYIGERKRLRIYLDSDDRGEKGLLWEEILLLAKEYGLAGATALRGIAGMGAHSQIHSFEIWSLGQKLPIIIEIIDTEAKIRGFLNQLEPRLHEGLITLEDVEVIAYKHPRFAP